MMFLAFYRGFHGRSFANVITWLIRKLTGGPYSHVAIVFGDGTGAEASGRPLFRRTAGVKWLPAARFSQGGWDLLPVAATEREEATARAFVAGHIGEGFDWASLWRFVIPWLKPGPGKWFCTGFVLKALQSAGLARNIPLNVCPSALMRVIEANDQGSFMCGNPDCRCFCPHRRGQENPRTTLLPRRHEPLRPLGANSLLVLASKVAAFSQDTVGPTEAPAETACKK